VLEGAGTAVSVTTVPKKMLSVQSAPQLIPAGADVTVPLPVPVLATVSRYWLRLKIALTVVAAVIVVTHVPVPEQPPPLHPTKLDPTEGRAVRVTTVPESKDAAQMAPQLIPVGAESTIPEPDPDLLTVSE
jgi:hypothetical protein